MGRLKELRKYVDDELSKMEDADKRNSAIGHLYGVSLAATMIAKRRGLDPELSSMAAMLHDLHAYKTDLMMTMRTRERSLQGIFLEN